MSPSALDPSAISENDLTPEEAEMYARGLYAIAQADGIRPREEALLRQFLAEAGLPLTYEELGRPIVSPLEAAQVFDATYQRRVFLRAAIALVQADGHLAPEETQAIQHFAAVFGISPEELSTLEAEAVRASVT